MTFDFTRRGMMAGLTGASVAAMIPVQLRAETAAGPVVRTTSYTRRVGEAEVTTLLDGYFLLDRTLITNIDPALVTERLSAAYLDPAAPLPLAIGVHLIRAGDSLTLVDAGAGVAFGPTSGRLAAALGDIGVTPDQITRVVLTHMHPDHIGGLMAGEAAAFGTASLHVSATDLAFWTDESIAASVPEGVQPFFALARGVAAAYGDRLVPFDGEADLGQGLTTLPLPGHTPGHTGLRLSSGKEQLLIWGDAAAIAALQFSHPDAGIVFDADGAMAAATRRKLLDMAAADKLLVAGTHLPFPGLGHVEARDGAYAFVPEEWRLL